METYVGPGALLELAGGALGLRPQTYREAAREVDATKLSIAVAVIAGAASAPVLGPSLQVVLPVAMVVGILLTLGILLIESAMVWGLCWIALPDARSFGQVMRPLAVAHAPRLAYLLVPVVGHVPALSIAISVWLLAAFVVAMQAATGRGWGVAITMSIAVGVLRWLAS